MAALVGADDVPDQQTSPSPTQELAQQIADELCGAGVIPDTKKAELLSKLHAGTISAQDWRLLIEMGMPRVKGAGDAAES